MNEINSPLLILVGPTAIGKTDLSLELAERFRCEIISMDSMQVYRYMDIGTAKVSKTEQNRVCHHLIDIVNPDEDYDVASFCRDAKNSINEISKRGYIPLITGGTGLYLQALLFGFFTDYQTDKSIRDELKKRLEKRGNQKLHAELSTFDPETAQRIHYNDTQRLIRALEIYIASGTTWSELLKKQKKEQKKKQFKNTLQIGLTTHREILYQRINKRVDIMLESGLEDEVKQLRKMKYAPSLKPMQAIGYRHINNYLDSKYDFHEMKKLLARDTRRYAKRQYTWFNRNPELCWFQQSEQKAIIKEIESWVKTFQ